LEQVSITTSQNVQIKYSLAGLGDRIFAYLIDTLIMISITIVMVIIFIYAGIFEGPSPMMGILVIVPAFFYHLVLEVTMQGQSIGKKIFNIKVVKLDGSQPNIGNYLLRWIIWPIDTFFYGGIAILCITIGGKGQRLGDIAAGTTVITLKKSGFLKDHTLSTLPANYVPVFTNADQLPAEFVDLIARVLKTQKEFYQSEPVTALAGKVKQKLHISTDMPDLKFLYTIQNDYHHLISIGNQQDSE
jgi:uncharacterized RDD family membrane protein YckC